MNLAEMEQAILSLQRRLDALGHHALEHEINGGDTVRPAVMNSGTRLNRHREVNFEDGLDATESSANKRIDVGVKDASVGGRKILLDFADSGNIAPTATPNSDTDIRGATVTFTPAVASLVKINISLVVQNNTDTDYFTISLKQDGALLVALTYRPAVAAIGSVFCYEYWVDAVTAASHTCKLSWQNSHAGDQLQIGKGHLYAEWYAT